MTTEGSGRIAAANQDTSRDCDESENKSFFEKTMKLKDNTENSAENNTEIQSNTEFERSRNRLIEKQLKSSARY